MKKTIAIMIFVLISIVLYSCNSTTEREPIDKNPVVVDGWVTYNGTLSEYVGNRKKATSPDNVTAVIINSESLQELHLSADVKTFEIENAPKLKKFTVSEENEYFVAINGKLYDKDYADVWGEYLTHPNSADWQIQNGHNEGEFFGYYEGKAKKATAPDYVTDVQLTSDNIEELHLSKNAQSIVIYSAPNLKKITVDDKNKHFTAIDGILYDKDVTKIVAYPYNHPAKKYVFPDTILFSMDMFGGKNVEEVVIHKKLEFPYRFADGFAEEYTTTASVRRTENLKKITVSEDNPYYSVIDDVLFNKDATVLLGYPPGETSPNYTVPSTVTKIAEGAFFDYTYYSHLNNIEPNRYLRTIDLPDNITFFADLRSDIYEDSIDIYGNSRSHEEMLRYMYENITFIVAENSTTHKTLKEFGLNIEFK